MSAVEPELLSWIDDEEVGVESRYRTERLRIHRMRLQACIRSVSPLVLDLASGHEGGLSSIAGRLRPYPELARCAALHPGSEPRLYPMNGKWPSAKNSHPWMRSADLRISRSFSRKGVILDVRDGRGELNFMISRGELVAGGWLGGCWFNTQGPQAHIVLQAEVPETVIAAAAGRTIGNVLSHPVLDGRDYPVTRAVRIDEGPAVVFTFETGSVPLELPWSDLLPGVGGGGG